LKVAQIIELSFDFWNLSGLAYGCIQVNLKTMESPMGHHGNVIFK
jgi:hypothetical protein